MRSQFSEEACKLEGHTEGTGGAYEGEAAQPGRSFLGDERLEETGLPRAGTAGLEDEPFTMRAAGTGHFSRAAASANPQRRHETWSHLGIESSLMCWCEVRKVREMKLEW